MSRPILVTSALPYANGEPHFGHMVGAYLPADIFVRYHRLLGSDVAFICGMDDHGVANTLGAESAVWSAGVGLGSTLSSWCLTIAMAAVGLGTDLRKLRGLGLKPLAVGFAAAAGVGAMSAGLLNVLPTV